MSFFLDIDFCNIYIELFIQRNLALLVKTNGIFCHGSVDNKPKTLYIKCVQTLTDEIWEATKG